MVSQPCQKYAIYLQSQFVTLSLTLLRILEHQEGSPIGSQQLSWAPCLTFFFQTRISFLWYRTMLPISNVWSHSSGILWDPASLDVPLICIFHFFRLCELLSLCLQTYSKLPHHERKEEENQHWLPILCFSVSPFSSKLHEGGICCLFSSLPDHSWCSSIWSVSALDGIITVCCFYVSYSGVRWSLELGMYKEVLIWF